MLSIKDKAQEIGVKTVLKYIEKDPENNINNVIKWLYRYDSDNILTPYLDAIAPLVSDRNNNWTKLIYSLFTDIDTHVRQVLFENFVLNTMMLSGKKRNEAKKTLNCNIPWAILLDPTSACNLHCIGCWAAEYGNKLNLTYDEIDSIINQGKELGVYMYIYAGGEPMVRKNDLIRLCKKHSDCIFLAFTNGTLIDEDFAHQMLKVGNFVPAISIEGDEAATDSRRGKGTYQQVMRAMEILKTNKLPFGASSCYTSFNIDSISSEEYMDSLVEFGCKFAWFFHYMPVGNDANLDLLPNPQQREKMYHAIRDFRKTKSIFTIDFQNDGEYVGGCIAGGRNYLHINANGDVEPCVFIHYSDSNIREKTLLEAFQSPLFMAYKDNQPFNNNHLRPCPMLENPEKLEGMVACTGAHSTDLQSLESAEHLCGKCKHYAQFWKDTADKLWQESHPEKK